MGYTIDSNSNEYHDIRIKNKCFNRDKETFYKNPWQCNDDFVYLNKLHVKVIVNLTGYEVAVSNIQSNTILLHQKGTITLRSNVNTPTSPDEYIITKESIVDTGAFSFTLGQVIIGGR